MTTVKYRQKEYGTNNGFLVNPKDIDSDWTNYVWKCYGGKNPGLPKKINPKRSSIIKKLQGEFKKTGEIPSLIQIKKITGYPLVELHKMFPAKDTLAFISKLAGLPKSIK